MEGGTMVANDGDEALIGLPPGFRFHPTDEEIITHYLTPKVVNRNFSASAIGEVDLNKCEPWDLPRRAKMGEKEWFFFCQRDRKYPTGMRTNRATDSGYWKATGKDKEIHKKGKAMGKLVGMKKTLVFYKGRAPKGEKTNWVMHEFRLEGDFSYYNMSRASKEEWVVCRIVQKSTEIRRNPNTDVHSNHGIGSFVDELLDSPPWMPPLMDTPGPHFDPNKPGSSYKNNITNNHNENSNLEKFKGLVDNENENYPSYFSHNHQPQLLQKDQDYKNFLVSPYNYNFDTNSYQINPYINDHHQSNFSHANTFSTNFPFLSSESTRYMGRVSGTEGEEGTAVGHCKVEPYVTTNTKQSSKISVTSQDTGISNDLTTEISSSSMHDIMRPYDQPDDQPALSELDSLLDY
ncbi:hypothetical protein LXL04_004734 [Taraxacum kok-saghyz]